MVTVASYTVYGETQRGTALHFPSGHLAAFPGSIMNSTPSSSVCAHTQPTPLVWQRTSIQSIYFINFPPSPLPAPFPRAIRCPLLVLAHQNLNQIVSPTAYPSSNTDYPFCPTISLPLSVPLNIMCLLLFGNTRNSR